MNIFKAKQKDNDDDVILLPYPKEYGPFGWFEVYRNDGFIIGSVAAWLLRDRTFGFRRAGSTVPHTDKSDEMVSKLKEAQHNAIKEVGIGRSQALFCAIARISGIKGRISEEWKNAPWQE